MLESVSPFFFALLCGLFAAAGTSLGGAVVFFVKDPTENFVSNANAAASGIMMFLCILDLVPDAKQARNRLKGRRILVWSRWSNCVPHDDGTPVLRLVKLREVLARHDVPLL